ncbi:LacI family transcriptional regulator [Solihabitans fulvus]|uniref:LacI family transcriptional regulator n=1 Tax=Solihabitans fulvus TaxID=1892852 RepID=A0A5B2WFS4_9PSEU|nr:LacI family transcriptional regulator [Solihabitans fulvus]
MRDIARRAGVSESAVSFALNNRPGVSEDTRQRILGVAKELSWHPNSAARALSAARAGTVGLVFARPAKTLGIEPFFLQLVSGMQAVLSVRASALLFQVVENMAAEMALYRQWWSEHRVDGVLVVDPRVDDPRPALLVELGLPALLIGGPTSTGTVPSIWADDTGAMASIVDYLVGLGHRRIAHIAGLPELIHTKRRIDSFRAATRKYGLSTHDSVATDYSDEAGARETRQLLAEPGPPTAIIYDNDVMAVAGVGVAGELGLSVPSDLSVVAWDDSVLCRLTHPQLTALVRDTHAFGSHAAQQLLALIEGEAPHDVEDDVPRLEPRGSTAPPPLP